jgi:hypothetical protein
MLSVLIVFLMLYRPGIGNDAHLTDTEESLFVLVIPKFIWANET